MSGLFRFIFMITYCDIFEVYLFSDVQVSDGNKYKTDKPFTLYS